MDVIDSKTSNEIHKKSGDYLKIFFSETFITEKMVECVVQRLKTSSYSSLGAIFSIKNILCNTKNYSSENLFCFSKGRGEKGCLGLCDVLVKKHNLLNELGTAGIALCEEAAKNEFNGDNFPEFYESLFSAIYTLSALKGELDLGLLDQILSQFNLFSNDSSLLALTTKMIDKIITM